MRMRPRRTRVRFLPGATAGASRIAACRVVALVPAHNEADRIGAALTALRAQTRPPERIVVVADNCTDATAGVARQAGAEVVESLNRHPSQEGQEPAPTLCRAS
ncbi:glycosyltransferase [Streptomyces collinus]|uniref:glycosyltransferase n=1 Tax=Streptomyces collinus TaxID=42684 RepID=UPI00363EEB29